LATQIEFSEITKSIDLGFGLSLAAHAARTACTGR
jgi:hypothetical protein